LKFFLLCNLKDETNMSEAAPAPQGRTAQTGTAQDSNKSGVRPGLVVGIGGVLTALAIGVVVATSSFGPATPAGSQLSLVAQGDITDAASTLSAQSAGSIVDNAKRCTIPMANLTLSKGAAGQAGMVRIRSGSYLSPPFSITDVPQRVAIPFPTDYASGIGQITVEGTVDDASVSLSPVVSVHQLNGSTPIKVWWTPRKPC
jgi:hypothetical protein